MIVLLARYTVQPGQTDKVIECLKEMAEKMKDTEPGCKVYRVHRPTDQSDTIVLYETYEDEEALEFHRNTSHFKEIIEGKVVPLLVRRDREMFDLVIDGTP
jgi:autoinducer 2-degrading protein